MKADRAASLRGHRPANAHVLGITRAIALGLPGIIAVVLLVPPPSGVPAIVLAVNPAILLCGAAFVGSFAARRLGLRSAILLGDALQLRTVFVAFGLGAVLGLGLAALDCATASVWKGAGSNLPALCETSGVSRLALGLLYGGVTEELIMRWGLLSLLALGLARLMSIRWSLLLGLLFSAGLFALAHIPSVWLTAPDPTAATLIRTLVLNTMAGLVFGALFLRSGLEAAIIAHIGFHCAAFASSFAIGPIF